MKKMLAINGSDLPKEMKKKLSALQRGSFYFIKGFKIDDVPLQLTHFYKGHLRFKILAWPTEEKAENLPPSQIPIIPRLSIKEMIRRSRIKMAHAPLEKMSRIQSKVERFEVVRRNRIIRSSAKGYVKLRYSTLKKAPYITFEKIPAEDLPMFIGDSENWTHLKDVLGIISNI